MWRRLISFFTSKATLHFEDTNDLLLAVHGADYYRCLLDIDNAMRMMLKHGHSMSGDEVCELVRGDILNAVNLDEIK